MIYGGVKVYPSLANGVILEFLDKILIVQFLINFGFLILNKTDHANLWTLEDHPLGINVRKKVLRVIAVILIMFPTFDSMFLISLTFLLRSKW